ncbi:MAG: DUF3343 domain-containing protein [Proteobacteria bacterium]|nr:DUF3343 domain-containing protein [Pseudomonadota bacterium]
MRLMPVPRQLSSDCGLSLVFHLSDREAASRALEEHGCPFEELHAKEGNGYRRLS